MQHTNVRIEPEPRVQSQPQTQRLQEQDNLPETNKKQKTQSYWWCYFLIRIIILVIFIGIIRGIVYAAYK